MPWLPKLPIKPLGLFTSSEDRYSLLQSNAQVLYEKEGQSYIVFISVTYSLIHEHKESCEASAHDTRTVNNSMKVSDAKREKSSQQETG